MLRLSLSIVLLAGLPLDSMGDNWPAFRGPTGMGQSTEKDLPAAWGKEQNILWKMPLPHAVSKGRPDNNQSSPIAGARRLS